MDRILIKDLLLRCIIGVNPDERRERQDVLINIVLFADLQPAGRSDNLNDAVDYRSLKKRILKEIENSHYQLVETLAERVAQICLDTDRVLQAQVTVEKPSALRFARSVGVEILRSRPTQS